MTCYLGSQLLKLFGSEFWSVSTLEIKVVGRVERNKMDVCMRHIKSLNGNAHTNTRHGLFQSLCHSLAEKLQVGKLRVI